MKIAIVAPIEEPIPPVGYGGVEWIVYLIAHHLGTKGHQIDLYASRDSQEDSGYKLTPIIDFSIRSHKEIFDNPKVKDAYKLLSLSKAATNIAEGNYDIIHNHASWRFLLFSPFLKTPIVTTHHHPLNAQFQSQAFLPYKDLLHVPLSNNQKKDLPELNFATTIYNGIDTHNITFSPESEDYLLFLGRITPEKGVMEAVHAAMKSHKKLIVAAKADPEHGDYFKEFTNLVAESQGLVSYINEVPHEKGIELMQKAKALLLPANYEDPCPLVPLEAMATGTPIIAFSMGALPEQVADGATGYLINKNDQTIRGSYRIQKTGIDGLSEAIEHVYAFSPEDYAALRKACRMHIENSFTVEKMVDQYEKLFKEILEKKIK